MKIKYFIKTFLIFACMCLFAISCMERGRTNVSEVVVDTAVPIVPTETPQPTKPPIPAGFTEYFTHSGDTLPVIAAHFGVGVDDITSENDLPPTAILDAGTRLLVRDILGETTPDDILFPDAAVVYSPEMVGFDIQAFADEQGGYLSTYTELMTRGTTPGSEIIHQLALEYSINPHMLLALIEMESGWVRGMPETRDQRLYPFGYMRADRGGVYQQTGWAITQLSQGYYGWRAGTLTELTFADGSTLRLPPSLNAGTVSVLFFFAQSHTRLEWQELIYDDGFPRIYADLYGDPWEQDGIVDPLFPAGITQPELNLPFPVNERWNLTGGPHSAWGKYGPRAALDFAPPLADPGCGNSIHWTTAAAAGRVVRTGNGVVVLDLDRDGYEQTGWVLVYMHVANSDRVILDAFVDADAVVGHPSCEGGSASGIHVHIARKYNGEWVLADGGIPFVMSGYETAVGEEPCDYAYFGFCTGTLSNGEKTVVADPFGNFRTAIYRPESDPKYFYTATPNP